MSSYVIATNGGEILQRGTFADNGQRPVRDDQLVLDGQLYWVWYVVWDGGLARMIVILATHAPGQYSSGPAIEQSIKRIQNTLEAAK